jgi:hypothetical protein
MCGILGIFLPKKQNLTDGETIGILHDLFLLANRRGNEAAGIVLADQDRIVMRKEATAAKRFVKSVKYRGIISDFLGQAKPGSPLAVIGHARLVTNGFQNKSSNNQPVTRDGVTLVHNGIVVNAESLWQTYGETPATELDSEVIAMLIARHRQEGNSLSGAIEMAGAELHGSASIALISALDEGLWLYSNHGSCYILVSDRAAVFASERLILEKIRRKHHAIFKKFPVIQAELCRPLPLHERFAASALSDKPTAKGLAIVSSRYRQLEDMSENSQLARDSLRRCTRCILPETMPFIEFDEQGVCNYCRRYQPMKTAGKEAALRAVQPFKRMDGAADSLLMLSGGRDSCYGLHYAVTELGLKPIAYTYDWGMITDLARRNASRLCGALGIEHIIVAADIAWKRANVRKNLFAWLKRPVLGMIPLLMAGDKQYFYYAHTIRRANRLPVAFVSENPLELTRFKAGFCGVNEGSGRIFEIAFRDKAKLLLYYLRQYGLNPRYLNSTLIDNAFAFAASYFLPHELFHLFRYEKWDEHKVVAAIIDNYGWETDPEAKSTWRIGDGTAAFYNYAYHTLAGLTENDTLRSNQIREGMLNRDEAMAMARAENEPRWQSMEWYAKTIGFNLVEALAIINRAPKLYGNEATIPIRINAINMIEET